MTEKAVHFAREHFEIHKSVKLLETTLDNAQLPTKAYNNKEGNNK